MTKTAQGRNTTWTREKVVNLIKLYRREACLWDHHNTAYKSKIERNKAIGQICTTLKITKHDFGKKIHNLRNQFNSEMKKLERRRAFTEDDIAGDPKSEYRCNWEHFENLFFLRNVIEPRPGPSSSFQMPKKIRLKYDYNSDGDTKIKQQDTIGRLDDADETEYHFEEAILQDETDRFQNFVDVQEEGSISAAAKDFNDKKYTLSKAASTSTHQINMRTTSPIQKNIKTKRTSITQIQQKQQQPEAMHLDDRQPGDVIELPIIDTATTTTNHCVPSLIEQNRKQQQSTTNCIALRDQWDAFGELIASELRHLNSDISRKKLKRKIMQSMLEVGEEDDGFALNTNEK